MSTFEKRLLTLARGIFVLFAAMFIVICGDKLDGWAVGFWFIFCLIVILKSEYDGDERTAPDGRHL
jgi:hypothetical protein